MTIDVRRQAHRSDVVLTGVFDDAAVGSFSALVSPLLYERRLRDVRIDLSRVAELSPDGVGALLFTWRFANRHGQRVAITGTSPEALAALQGTELFDVAV